MRDSLCGREVYTQVHSESTDFLAVVENRIIALSVQENTVRIELRQVLLGQRRGATDRLRVHRSVHLITNQSFAFY